jgi:tRNA(Arg) A34 adenosine deaminase TadA
MCRCTRRSTVLGLASALLATRAGAATTEHRDFVAAAFKMKDEAVVAGDQPYGAVVVKDRSVVGYGPSRVVAKQDATAHAEREAIRDAQARLGTADLCGCVLYSTSRPCQACERAAADAHIARMIHGAEAIDAGVPR